MFDQEALLGDVYVTKNLGGKLRIFIIGGTERSYVWLTNDVRIWWLDYTFGVKTRLHLSLIGQKV